jgi:hypothetical protein
LAVPTSSPQLRPNRSCRQPILRGGGGGGAGAADSWEDTRLGRVACCTQVQRG